MTTDRADQHLSLSARDDLLYIADAWPALHGLLSTGGGSALTGLPGASSPEPPLVLNVDVLDLMTEIEDLARFYGQVLCEETTWTPSTSAMPTLLIEVASRHGHFTAGDDQTALEFMDAAHDFREKVHKALAQHVPPRYVGPCQTFECTGELYVSQGLDGGKCRVCGMLFTLVEQQRWIAEQFETQTMPACEIGVALKCMGFTTQPTTVRTWVKRLRLNPDRVFGPLTFIESEEPARYRIADAKALAEGMRHAA